MKRKLWIFFMLFLSLNAFTQQTGLRGVIIDAKNGKPLPGINVLLKNQNQVVVTGANGEFFIPVSVEGYDFIRVYSDNIDPLQQQVKLQKNQSTNLGEIRVKADEIKVRKDESAIFVFDESQLDEDQSSSQNIGSLSSASDDIFLKASGYSFGPMRYRVRGYNDEYSRTSINGVNFDDSERGRFNYSMLGGMNDAFKNKTITNGSEMSGFAFGGIGGTTNINTRASNYAAGTKASVAYTNRNYKVRGTASYSTGLMPNGWAFSATGIFRYADEGNVQGTFYNSWGYFLTLEKILNDKHSLSLTSFGAPSQRGTQSASFDECYELTNNYLYNPNWGYQNGKKRNARVVDSFDPVTVLSHEWKINKNTKLNTGAGFRYSNYGSTSLNWYNAADPRPDYYRNLPSYQSTTDMKNQYTHEWQTESNMSQINWDKLYFINELNNRTIGNDKTKQGSKYMIEDRHNDQLEFTFNSTFNSRLNKIMTFQGGVGLRLTQGRHYKKVDDLMGGKYWIDIDQFAERDFAGNNVIMQNDLNNPNAVKQVGDIFGYNYNTNVLLASAWVQNNINLNRWDMYYALNMSLSKYQRDGKMRNGRAVNNSYGKGELMSFYNPGAKAGITYKINGRNFIIANGLYQSNAPWANNAYISPRIKDDVIPNLKSERVASYDLTYSFSYPKFRGRITAYQTHFLDQTEVDNFYHDEYRTYVNYIMTGVRKRHQGIELGVAYKITPSVTLSGVGSIAQYQYKNRPTGIISFENGSRPDTTETVYLKNFYVGGTPQQVGSIAIDWAAPKMWFFNINVNFYDKGYVDLSPIHRTGKIMNFPKTGMIEDQSIVDHAKELVKQEELHGGFTVDASIGKLIYINRKYSLNLNLSFSNILNNKKLQSGGYEQGRFDFTNYDVSKFPNKYYYAQGFNVFANVGFKF